METRTINITFPMDVFSALNKTPEELSDEIRLAAAVKWYEMGIVSQDKAAEIAGKNREDFLLSLPKFRDLSFQHSSDETLREAGYSKDEKRLTDEFLSVCGTWLDDRTVEDQIRDIYRARRSREAIMEID